MSPSWPRILPISILALSACAPKTEDPDRPLEQRHRDSVIGASKLPGAAGVRGALRAQDSAKARVDRQNEGTRE
jgi:hypothetical protein